jgi:hypothetical protein
MMVALAGKYRIPPGDGALKLGSVESYPADDEWCRDVFHPLPVHVQSEIMSAHLA